jgi:hypothetical protein
MRFSYHYKYGRAVIGETAHQSCLIVTSREKPTEMVALEGLVSVHSMQLRGVAEAAIALFQGKQVSGSDTQKQEIGDRYGNNSLALKIVVTSIQDLFDGEIGTFLEQDTLLFNGICQLLERQFHRLSPLEQTIMYWLAINRDWTAIAQLREDIVPAISRANLFTALEGLNGRSLIEKQSGSYTQQPVVMEYVTDQLIERITTELITTQISLLLSHALLKTTVKDYIRESQRRLILGGITEQIRKTFSSPKAIEQQLQRILTQLRASPNPLPGYGGSNLLNLCHELKIDLTGYDFSGLTIWQAYLQEANLHHVNFQNAELVKSVFAETFSGVFSVAFSPDGKLLATGDNDGEIRLWQVADGKQLWLSRTCSDKKISLMIRKACCLRLAGWVKVRSSTY